MVAGRGSRVQCRGRGSNIAAGENDLGFEVQVQRLSSSFQLLTQRVSFRSLRPGSFSTSVFFIL